jgi:hypothetical protein
MIKMSICRFIVSAMRFYFSLFLLFISVKSNAQEFRGGEIFFVKSDVTHFDAFIDVYYNGDVATPKPFLRFLCSFLPVDTAEFVSKDSLTTDFYRLRYRGNFYIFDEGYPYHFTVLDTFYLPPLKNLEGNKKEFYLLNASWMAPYYQWFGNNSPPVFDYNPSSYYFDDGVFIFDSKATDPDGDTLFYGLKDYNNSNYPDDYIYTLPAASDSFSCDFLQGEIKWDKPVEPGKYLFGVLVASYNEGATFMGFSQRDIIVEIKEEDILSSTTEEDLRSPTFSIYPNPTSQMLRLDIAPTTGLKGNCILTGWDMLGKVVYYKTFPNVDIQFFEKVDVSLWKPGIYCFTLTVNGRVMTKRVVVE